MDAVARCASMRSELVFEVSMDEWLPAFRGYTFMDGNYNPNQNRPDCIPAMQNGMGIISYLKYHEWSGRREPKVLEIARSMGDFLVKENLTPDNGKYPRFPRSTGRRFQFPQPPDCGS